MTNAASELQDMLDDEMEGRRVNVPFPFPLLTHVTQALLPGTITVLCGTPGASKSLFVLMCLAYWLDAKLNASLFALEEPRAFHLKRVLAQRSRNSKLTQPLWVKANPNAVQAAYSEHSLWLDLIGPMIYDDEMSTADYDTVLAWVREMADVAEGLAPHSIIAIDPVSIVAPDRDIAAADRAFVRECKTIAESQGTRLLLVTHPRGKEMGLDDLAGGRCWGRFAQTVIWLEHHDSYQKRTIAGEFGLPPIEKQSNRTMHVMKARNSCGTGYKIAYDFNPGSLTFEEQGLIVT